MYKGKRFGNAITRPSRNNPSWAKWRVKDLAPIIRAARRLKSFRVITLGSSPRQMIFNLQDPSSPAPPSSRVPVRSPCRRSLWSRSCPGVAGGWDPASFRPSSLSPYLPLAFSPPLNRTFPFRRVPDTPSRLSSLLSPPVSRADPPSSLSSTRASRSSHGRGILKRVGPCAHNPPGLQPERIGPWETDRLANATHRVSSPPAWLSVRQEARGRPRPCDAKIFPWKEPAYARGPCPNNNPGYQRHSLHPLRKRDDRARAHAGKLWFSFRRLSRLLVVEGSPGVAAEGCSLKPSAQTRVYYGEADFASKMVTHR